MLDNVHGAGRERARHDRRGPQGRVQHPELRPREARDAQHLRRTPGAEPTPRSTRRSAGSSAGRSPSSGSSSRSSPRCRCAASSATRWSTARSATSIARSTPSIRPTAPAVLKAIEQFAVECSVNKVFTSETLAYVVDEALQVFGGNGYSREFPAERAYRDARITRIYEGTNEINRMIVATRLAEEPGEVRRQKSASRAQIPTSSPLVGGVRAARPAKRLALVLLADASAAFGSTAEGRAGTARARVEHRHRRLRHRKRPGAHREDCRARRRAGAGGGGRGAGVRERCRRSHRCMRPSRSPAPSPAAAAAGLPNSSPPSPRIPAWTRLPPAAGSRTRSFARAVIRSRRTHVADPNRVAGIRL